MGWLTQFNLRNTDIRADSVVDLVRLLRKFNVKSVDCTAKDSRYYYNFAKRYWPQRNR
jgi:hypothetical protein